MEMGSLVNDDTILVYRFSTLTPSALPTLVDRTSDPRSNDEGVSVVENSLA